MGGGSKVVEGDESELELGLGLGLGLGPGSRRGAWAERGRILTARDFTYSVGTMRASDYSSAASPPRSTQIVGWPPVGIHRMNSLVNVNQSVKFEKAEPEGNKTDVGQNDKSKDTLRTTTGNGKPGYVKVNMDRVGIGRKVDLNAYSSYENLARTLEEMFFKSGSAIGSGDLKLTSNAFPGSSQKKEIAMGSKLLDGSADYVLTYEDKEGDWMLVGDVPWRMFRGSVRRIRIMKTTEANGLAPRHQESLVE